MFRTFARYFLGVVSIVMVWRATPALSKQYDLTVESTFSEMGLPVEKAIRDFGLINRIFFGRCGFHGQEISIGANELGQAYFVTTKDECGWGPYAAPVWIVNVKEGKGEVLLSTSTYGLEIQKERNNGRNDLRFITGSPFKERLQYWVFDGLKYGKK